MVEDLGEAFWSRIITVDETWLPFTFQKQRSSWSSSVELERSPLWRQRPYLPPARLWSQSFGTVMGLFSLITYPRELPSTAYTTQTCYRRISAQLSRTNGEENCLHHRYCNMTTPVPIQQRWRRMPSSGWAGHPPYSPDLAPSDYHLFHTLKQPLRGHHFAALDEMKNAISKWTTETPRSFFDTGKRKLTAKWEKCVRLNGNYTEKFDVDSDDNWSFYYWLLFLSPRNFWDAPRTFICPKKLFWYFWEWVQTFGHDCHVQCIVLYWTNAMIALWYQYIHVQ